MRAYIRDLQVDYDDGTDRYGQKFSDGTVEAKVTLRGDGTLGAMLQQAMRNGYLDVGGEQFYVEGDRSLRAELAQVAIQLAESNAERKKLEERLERKLNFADTWAAELEADGEHVSILVGDADARVDLTTARELGQKLVELTKADIIMKFRSFGEMSEEQRREIRTQLDELRSFIRGGLEA